MQLYLVGGGPGHPDYLTGRARQLISSATRVAAFGRLAEDLLPLNPRLLALPSVARALEFAREGGVLVVSGDPSFYGLSDLLRREGLEFITEPGISSPQYLAAKIGWSWQGARLLSLHGRECDLSLLQAGERAFILTDRQHPPALISTQLAKMGRSGRLIVGHQLSYPEEYLEECALGETPLKESDLCVVAVEVRA